MRAETIAAISELIIKHGVPAALQIIKTWDVENPTLEDIENLRTLVPDPDTYFEDNTVTAGG